MEQYVPREGVDYMVDLYGVAGATPDMAPAEIKTKINARLGEYHPDRLQGLAPEFNEKGLRMTKFLNRARKILLGEGRQEYDELLAQWPGPISTDGTAVMSFDEYQRKQLALQDEAGIAEYFDQSDQAVGTMFGYSERARRRFEGKIAGGQQLNEDEHAEYDEILAAQDKQLTIKEKVRMVALGAAANDEPVAAIGYDHADGVRAALVAAEREAEDRNRSITGGKFAARLAILSGEQPPEGVVAVSAEPVASGIAAVHGQVQAIAAQREQLLHKRLDAMYIEYPQQAEQSELRSRVLVGVTVGDGEQTIWLGFDCSTEDNHAEGFELPAAVQAHLDAGDVAAVAADTYSVIRFNTLAGVAHETAISAVLQRHMSKLAQSDKQ